MKLIELLESSTGTTSSASIAVLPVPLGGVFGRKNCCFSPVASVKKKKKNKKSTSSKTSS